MDEKKIPSKLFFKIGEVCELTDTQPYVLRYWESECPALAPAKNAAGQRIYRRRDIKTVLRIKTLLYEEGFTIAGAKKRLEQEMKEPASKQEAAPAGESASEAASKQERIQDIKGELRGILDLLDRHDSQLKAKLKER